MVGICDYEGLTFNLLARGIAEPLAFESGPVGDVCGWIAGGSAAASGGVAMDPAMDGDPSGMEWESIPEGIPDPSPNDPSPDP